MGSCPFEADVGVRAVGGGHEPAYELPGDPSHDGVGEYERYEEDDGPYDQEIAYEIDQTVGTVPDVEVQVVSADDQR